MSLILKKIAILFLVIGTISIGLSCVEVKRENSALNKRLDLNYVRDGELFKSQVVDLFEKSERGSPQLFYNYTDWCNESIFLNKPIYYAQSVLQAAGQKGPVLNSKFYNPYPKDSVINGGFIIYKSLISSVTFGITFLVDVKDPEKKVIKITSCGVNSATL